MKPKLIKTRTIILYQNGLRITSRFTAEGAAADSLIFACPPLFMSGIRTAHTIDGGDESWANDPATQ